MSRKSHSTETLTELMEASVIILHFWCLCMKVKWCLKVSSQGTSTSLYIYVPTGPYMFPMSPFGRATD